MIERPQTDVSSAGQGVEAPPWSPGHVGHTPQRVDVMLRNSRIRGILSSGLALVMPNEYAMGAFGRLQRPERLGHVSTLLAIEDFRRRQSVAQPGPNDFRDMILGPLPSEEG